MPDLAPVPAPIYKKILTKDLELFGERLTFLETKKDQAIPYVLAEIAAIKRIIAFFGGNYAIYVRKEAF